MQSSEISAKQSRLEPTSTVPFLRDRDFIDRGNIMANISEMLSYPGARVALLGFGGIGYVYDYTNTFIAIILMLH